MARIFNSILIALVSIAVNVNSFPLEKRIAQTISDSTTQWEAACDAAGGGAQCNTIAVNAFGNLLAAADPCGQQNASDTMINLAKQLNSNADMIKLAQIFAQQPRNSPTSQAVPYCQSAPQNAELDGLFQCQFQSADEQTFVGGLAVGSAGTIPFGMTSPVSPAGSCPAHTTGPIPDGEQLVDITQDPGVGSTGSNSTASGTSTIVASSTVASATAVPSAAVPSAAVSSAAVFSSAAEATSAASSAAATATASSGNSSSSFLLSNGQAAQQQNTEFATLTANSSCTEGTDACVNGTFAQCVGGSYVTQSCGATLSCFALPLVNKQGTSVTCTTESDAETRIAATGATGGITGDSSAGSSSTLASASLNVAAVATSATPCATSAATSSMTASASGSSFLLSNGQKAQQLNAQFATLTTNGSCSDGEEACVNGMFAQCSGDSYVTQSCGATLTCFALPLVNSAGTSITCTTQADAESRIANTGATGGLTGNGN